VNSGGRNPVTPRLTRHFNFLSFTELEHDSMRKIFSTIFNWWARQNDYLLSLSDKLVMSSIEIYKTVCASLLPTPSKSHYTFNLRDLSKVFQGVLMMESKKVDVNIKSDFNLIQLKFFLFNRVLNVFFVYGIMKIVVYFKIV
jgi:dynein heavy chain